MDFAFALTVLVLTGTMLAWLGVAVVISGLLTIYYAKGKEFFSAEVGKYFLKVLGITIPICAVVAVFVIYLFSGPM